MKVIENKVIFNLFINLYKLVTVGIPSLEYQLRRQKLVNSLPKGSAVVCIGNNLQFKDHNIL
jgi:hypothetical protein